MLANQMKKLRNQKGLTQQELADILHVSKGTVGMWETGRREPNTEILSELADFYGVTVDYLLGRDQLSPAQEAAVQETIRTLEELTQRLRTMFPSE